MSLLVSPLHFSVRSLLIVLNCCSGDEDGGGCRGVYWSQRIMHKTRSLPEKRRNQLQAPGELPLASLSTEKGT